MNHSYKTCLLLFSLHFIQKTGFSHDWASQANLLGTVRLSFSQEEI